MSEFQALPKLTQAQQGATRRYSEKNSSAAISRILFRQHKLSQRQLNAVEMLLHGLSDAQVAHQVGVDRGTIYRWRKWDKFAAEMERQRREAMQQSASRLQSMLNPALDILQKQISGDDPEIALRAAAILLRAATPARLQRWIDPVRTADEKSLTGDRFMQNADSYIDTPMPGEELDHSDLEDDDEYA